MAAKDDMEVKGEEVEEGVEAVQEDEDILSRGEIATILQDQHLHFLDFLARVGEVTEKQVETEKDGKWKKFSKSGMSSDKVLERFAQMVFFARENTEAGGSSRHFFRECDYVRSMACMMSTFLQISESPQTVRFASSTLEKAVLEALCDALLLHRDTPSALFQDDREVRRQLLLALISRPVDGPARTPVVYTADTTWIDVIVDGIGLPSESISIVSLAEQRGSGPRSICLSALKEAIKEDILNGRRPLMVVACVGGGQVDDVEQLGEICYENKMWLHAQGEDIPISLLSQKSVHKGFGTAGSFSVSTYDSFDLPKGPGCLFFRDDASSSLIPGARNALEPAVSLWLFLQYYGTRKMSETFEQSLEFTREFSKRLENVRFIEQYSPNMSFTTVFRYVPQVSDRNFEGDFLDELTQQILLDLGDEAANVGLESFELGGRVFMRFRPCVAQEMTDFESSPLPSILEKLQIECQCINDTLSGCNLFERAVAIDTELQYVLSPHSVGLGSVRLFPSILPRDDDLSPEMKFELDNLNRLLASKLAETDDIFTAGTTGNGDVCIRLGVDVAPVTEASVAKYLEQIKDTAATLDLYHKLMSDMEEMVRKNIREAEQQLEEEKYMQQAKKGFIRNIPYVGSMWEWIAPPEEDAPCQGRSFDIARNSVPTPASFTVKARPSMEGGEGEVKDEVPEAPQSPAVPEEPEEAAESASAGEIASSPTRDDPHSDADAPATISDDEEFTEALVAVAENEEEKEEDE
eukprot:CAMPEP_0119133776 /NCGR_PEP_ID=MMETSP1310-20130426/13547_1 /TAXON_ID=464262 /ORGANISM="Genus nov. species nov., Strain RCC2339" /LENGTH=750 /DNA_ID=CAMNT_0007124479 /DNA_START=52 /DNA_END=2304 /DNA_ORIENTATION=-